MFSFLRSNAELKGFKVCKSEERTRKFGIAASSLKDLREKIKIKLKIENFDLYFDKSLISDEDYFKFIPNQSIIVAVSEGDILKTGEVNFWNFF